MADLAGRVQRLIADPAAEPFDQLALELFRFQHASSSAYRAWCEALGTSSDAVGSPDDIPAVPVAAWKELEFVCGTPGAEFRTSGVTGSGRGRHLLPSVEVYRAASLAWFKACVMPEGWRLRTLILAPPPALRPHSSLSRMCAWILEDQAEPGGGWCIGPDGLERDRWTEALLDAQRGGTPVLILATSAALLAALAELDRDRIRVVLPGGSRLMDTGGQKGAGRPVPAAPADFQEELYARVEATLGIPAGRCVNEYGMTELSSQAYDDVLRRARPADAPRIKRFPPWARVAAVDPVTMTVLPPGQTGLLRVLDLANWGSVAHVLTEDLGAVTDDGGVILAGRPRDAEARGCGLSYVELSRLTGAPG